MENYSYNGNPQPVTPYTKQKPVKDKGKSYASYSLLAGILSLTLFFGSFVPSVLAIIFGCLSKKHNYAYHKKATTGIVLGVIGCIISLIVFICLICMSS